VEVGMGNQRLAKSAERYPYRMAAVEGLTWYR
jgi:hypothetical protein